MLGRTLLGCALLVCTATCAATPCTCPDQGDDLESVVAERFDAADLIAVAEVTGDTAAPIGVGSRTRDGRWWTLVIQRVFKGAARPGAWFYATTPGIRSTCDPAVAPGDLVLAYVEAGELVDLSACSASGPIESRADELEVLSRLAPDPR